MAKSYIGPPITVGYIRTVAHEARRLGMTEEELARKWLTPDEYKRWEREKMDGDQERLFAQ